MEKGRLRLIAGSYPPFQKGGAGLSTGTLQGPGALPPEGLAIFAELGGAVRMPCLSKVQAFRTRRIRDGSRRPMFLIFRSLHLTRS
jgi:hypothetical protein